MFSIFYFVPTIFGISTHNIVPPGRFGGGSQEARVGDSLKIPPQPSSTGHNILKQIIPNCLVDSSADLLNGISISWAKYNQNHEQFQRRINGLPIELKIYFQHFSILSITDCHLQKSWMVTSGPSLIIKLVRFVAIRALKLNAF